MADGMKERSGLGAIVFDAYGTLLDVMSVARTADRLMPGQGMAVAQLWRTKQIEYTMLRTLSGHYVGFDQVTRDALLFALDQFETSLAASDIAALLDRFLHLSPHPEVPAALARIRTAGLPMAILSNGTPAMLEVMLSHAGIAQAFDAVLSVDTVGRFKTAPEAYQLGPDWIGQPADTLLFVSSNCWDVCGAGWFGYLSFWINRAGAPLDRLDIEPYRVGRSIADVATFLAPAA